MSVPSQSQDHWDITVTVTLFACENQKCFHGEDWQSKLELKVFLAEQSWHKMELLTGSLMVKATSSIYLLVWASGWNYWLVALTDAFVPIQCHVSCWLLFLLVKVCGHVAGWQLLYCGPKWAFPYTYECIFPSHCLLALKSLICQCMCWSIL